MNQIISDNKRIAKNSVMLYIRMIFLMFVNLYTARIVLSSLGVENYGIYNAVGGFISMFSMISASLSTAISRYITYTLGEDNRGKLGNIFSASVIILLILCIFLFIVAETVGIWFLNTHMTIPEERVYAANWVFQLSLTTFVINLLSIPYNAALIAHEKMSAFAYIGIYEGLVLLGVAFLIKISPIDTLVFYAILMCCVAVSTRLIYGTYCSRSFEECRVRWYFDKNIIKEMFGFAGWNFVGTTSGVLRTQGINMLFNVYNGPIVNAANGLCMQVFNAVNKFSGNFYMAVHPQITKSFAAGERLRTISLVFMSSRLAFFLLMLIILPILWETDFLLSLWLSKIPLYTVSFVQIILLFCLVESFSQPLIYLMLATGKIKNYQLIVGGLCLLNFPVAWIILAQGYSPESAQCTILIFSILCLFVRLYMLRSMVKFPVRRFLVSVVGRVSCIFALSCIIPFFIHTILEVSLKRFIISVFLIEILALLLIYLIGLSKEERIFIHSKLHILRCHHCRNTKQ